MREHEFTTESAARELADTLPTLKRTDYDAIDSLMKRISIKHKISSKKLHNIFVSKYGHSPDHWVKQIKQRNEEVNEDGSDFDTNKVDKFIEIEFNKANERGRLCFIQMAREPGFNKIVGIP